MGRERDPQGEFSSYEQCLSAISSFKGVVNVEGRRRALHHYRDLGSEWEESMEGGA